MSQTSHSQRPLCATLTGATKTKMTNLLSIVFIFVATGIISGLIYLIYLPFKKRLIKSGRLNEKRNRQVNRTILFSAFLLFIILYYLKDYRISSKDRLEKISAVKLPENFKVLKDEYQDMLPDYSILYDIQFDRNSATELINNIKTSKFYNKDAFHKGAWVETDYITIDSVKAIWCKSPMGYDFSGEVGSTEYYIELDTMTSILKYAEIED